jgi:hypothetical protein
MRILFFFLLFFPLLASASGADDTEYLGLRSNNQLVRLKFFSDPTVWSKNNFIYASSGNSKLKFCWLESAPNTDTPKSFSCTRQANAKASVSFLPVEVNAGIRSRFAKVAKLAKIDNSQTRGAGTLVGAYQCKTGCSVDVPKFMFQVTYYD